MPGPHLIYFANPMCSWCWGFSPVVDTVRERFGPFLPIRLILGGLRPGTTEPMTEGSKREPLIALGFRTAAGEVRDDGRLEH